MGSGYEYALTGHLIEKEKKKKQKKALKAIRNDPDLNICIVTSDTANLDQMATKLLDVNSAGSSDRRSDRLEDFMYSHADDLKVVTYSGSNSGLLQQTIEKAIKTLSAGSTLDRRQIQELSNITKFNILSMKTEKLLKTALTDAFNSGEGFDVEEKFRELIRSSFKGKKSKGPSL